MSRSPDTLSRAPRSGRIGSPTIMNSFTDSCLSFMRQLRLRGEWSRWKSAGVVWLADDTSQVPGSDRCFHAGDRCQLTRNRRLRSPAVRVCVISQEVADQLNVGLHWSDPLPFS